MDPIVPPAEEETPDLEGKVEISEKTREIYIVDGGNLIDAAEPTNEQVQLFLDAALAGDRRMVVELIKDIDKNARNWGVAHGIALSNEDIDEVLFDGHLPVRLGKDDKGAIVGSATGVKRGDIVTLTINFGDSAGKDMMTILNSNWPAGLYFAMMRDLEKVSEEQLAEEIAEVVEKADG